MQGAVLAVAPVADIRQRGQRAAADLCGEAAAD